MKISTKGRYGLRAILDLARIQDAGCLSLAEISRQENLSLNYLERLFAKLRGAGLVTSAAGALGGYRLARPPEEITAKMVLEALESDLSITDRSQETGGELRQFLACEVWDKVDDGVLDVLEKTTLRELLD